MKSKTEKTEIKKSKTYILYDSSDGSTEYFDNVKELTQHLEDEYQKCDLLPESFIDEVTVYVAKEVKVKIKPAKISIKGDK